MKKPILIFSLCLFFFSCSYDQENLLLEDKVESTQLSSRASNRGISCGTTGIVGELPLNDFEA